MKKELYEAPVVQVIEMEVQGMIAVSGPPDVQKQEWGS